MNIRPSTLMSLEASWTSNAAAGVFTQRKLTLIISQAGEVTWGSHLVGLELNKAGSREATDWLSDQIYWVRTV